MNPDPGRPPCLQTGLDCGAGIEDFEGRASFMFCFHLRVGAFDAAPPPHPRQTRTIPALHPYPWAYAPRLLAGCYGRHCAPCKSGAPTLTSARRSCRQSSASAPATGGPGRACIISSLCPQAPIATLILSMYARRIRGCSPSTPLNQTGSPVHTSSSTTTQSALTLQQPNPNA